MNTNEMNNGLVDELEAWPEVVDGAALLDELRNVMRRYVVLPSMAAEALAAWVVHTYAFELRSVSTYIGIGSPEKRCGKTTLLSVLSDLVNRPVVASNISPPALFRVIEEARPTLLIDEGDTFLQGNDELKGILNSGYTRKTAYVVRVANKIMNYEGRIKKEEEEGAERPSGLGTRGNSSFQNDVKGSRLVRFSTWCPKVIAAIGKLPETLMDRCITITMQRKMAQETCERLRNLDGTELRRKCLRFVTDHAEAIAAAKLEMPAQLNDRAADIWEPLLAVADLAGGEWPKVLREAALKLSAGVAESNVIGSLLVDILVAFRLLNVDRLFSRDMVGCLNECKERPWAEARRGKDVDELWLAQQLRPYGVRPRSIWINGKGAKGYMESDFAEVWPRYVSWSDVEAVIGEEDDEESTESVNTPNRSSEAGMSNDEGSTKHQYPSTRE